MESIKQLSMAIPFGAASPSSLELLHSLQDPLDMTHLRDPQVSKIPPRQGQ